MCSKKYILKKDFHNKIKSKSLRKFRQKTPQGNFVSGWICHEPGEYLSSMVLTEIETKDRTISVHRFIKGMPKQHYWSESWDLYENKEFTLYSCHEKLDGTCLMTYALYDEDDNLIEIVPRTRGMAVAADHILDMFNLIDTAQIEEFYSYPHNYDYVLMFELYGMLNRHEITYNRFYIDIRIIGATLFEEVLNKKELFALAFQHHFSVPNLLFDICSHNGKWKIWPVKSRLYPYYINDEVFDVYYNSLGESINALVDIMESINQNYKNKNGYIPIEGVVINGIDENQKQRYIKIKPKSVFEMAKLADGVPSAAIRKEVYKYFDEYGPFKVKEIYNEDKLHFMKFVQEKLLEEFPEEYVKSGQTTQRISNIFFETWEKKEPNDTIQKVCRSLVDKYPDEEVSDIMKIFAVEYPHMKKHSNAVYSILTYLVKE